MKIYKITEASDLITTREQLEALTNSVIDKIQMVFRGCLIALGVYLTIMAVWKLCRIIKEEDK